ncbi:MAG: hypothetical protein K8R53_14055 [Bacteroidales bacterium]|nr:hypothetical protein [Bacteroidales bacterium]
MKKYIAIILIGFFCLGIAFSQDTIPEQKPPKTKSGSFKDKVYFGGGVGLSFGNYTRIAVYPMIGYNITPKLSGGLELGYEYISDNRYNTKYNTSNYGASLFARYRLVPQLFFHTEYAMYSYELYGFDGKSVREWIPFLFLGAGYVQQIGPRVSVYAMVKFDVLQNSKSPYNEWEPFFAVGVSMGF